jgi:N-acetylglucosaminyldiphosphoundecaprenol N-acetyl-beta-D-mannosaminyltransferase
MRTRTRIISLDVDVTDYEQTIATVDKLARAGRGGYVCVANVHMTIEAHDDPHYAEQVNAAELVVPDGRPLSWAQKNAGHANATQVRGPSLMPMLMEHAERDGLNVGFYGGSPEVVERIIERAHGEYPRLQISYAYSPPFRALTVEEDAEVVVKINASNTQILFVGLGCPKGERWMAEHRDRLGAVMLGVGAAFDFYAGTLAEAPEWMRSAGLEWLYRLGSEPSRLWRRYLYTNSRFLYLLFTKSGR